MVRRRTDRRSRRRAGYGPFGARYLRTAPPPRRARRGQALCHGGAHRASAGADRLDSIPLRDARRVPPGGLLFAREPGKRPRGLLVLHVPGRVHRTGHDRCRGVGGQRHVAQRPYVALCQFGAGHGGPACGFRTSACRMGRAGGAEIPAAVRRVGAAAGRGASDRSGTAGRRFRGGPRKRVAAPNVVHSRYHAVASGRVDARLHRAGTASGHRDLRPPDARVSDQRSGGRGRGVAHLDARARAARPRDADASRNEGFVSRRRGGRLRRRHHFCGARRRTNRRGGKNYIR